MFNWFSLTVISVIFIVSYYFLSKKLLNEADDVDPRLFGAAEQFSVGLLALPIAIYNGFYFKLDSVSGILLVLMTATYIIGPSLYYVGLKHVELSEAIVLGSTSVVWAVLFGVLLLGETITRMNLFGVALVFTAIFILTFSENKSFSQLSKYKFFLLVQAAFYALGAILDNRLLNFSNAFSYMAVSFLTAGFCMFVVNLPRFGVVGKKTFGNKLFWKILPMDALFLYLTYLCVMEAYTLGGEVSRMFPIQQTESILVPLVGIIVFKEVKNVPVKIGTAILAFIGILLIKL